MKILLPYFLIILLLTISPSLTENESSEESTEVETTTAAATTTRPRNTKVRSLLVARNEVKDINEALVEESDTGKPQWDASTKTKFALTEEIPLGMAPEENKGVRGGAAMRPPNNRRIPLKPGETKAATGKIKLPKTYDAREVYGKKCPSFNHITFQGKCSNCWAMASISMINDRVCMYQTGNATQKYFSAKQLTTCIPNGCVGGTFGTAFKYWIDNGLYTGGDFRMKQPAGCNPYPRNTEEMKNGTCNTKCDDGRSPTVEERSRGVGRYVINSKRQEEIMAEIFLYGPVVTTFDVYEDFAHYYTGGVYKYVSGKKLGGHAAKIFGWGVEEGVPFWHCANSWGTDWGEDGFFRIQRGTDECRIETGIHAVIPEGGLF